MQYNPISNKLDQYRQMGMSEQQIQDIVIPAYSSYIEEKQKPMSITMNDLNSYLSLSPQERQAVKDKQTFLSAISPERELDLRVGEAMIKHQEKQSKETISPKINILKRIPHYKCKVDISHLHGADISTKGLVTELDTSVVDDIGTSKPRIVIKPTVTKSESKPLINIQPTGNVVSSSALGVATPLPEITEDLVVVEQPWVMPQQAMVNEHGFITPYDASGVNRCLEINPNYIEEQKKAKRGLFGGYDDTTSLIGPSSVNLSPGYNNGCYDAFGFNSGGSNYLGYGNSLYGSRGGNYGIYGIYANGVNPILMQRQKEAEEQAKLEQRQMEIELQKKLYRASCAFDNSEPEQKVLDIIDGTFETNYIETLSGQERVQYEKIRIAENNFNNAYNRLSALELQPWYKDEKAERWREHYCNYIEKEKQKAPDSMGLVEWLETIAPGKLVEAYERETEANDRKEIRNLCNDDLYNRELENKRRMLMTIDDNEVFLPNKSSSSNYMVSSSEAESRKRRQQFLSALVASRESM